MSDWKIFTGAGIAEEEALTKWPPVPPWRPFGKDAKLVPPPQPEAANDDLDYALARTFRATPEMIDAVNTALYLRRPLLITGKPGNGKSSLIRAVARELRMGPVLRWAITSRSTLKEGLYLYDALGRLDHRNRFVPPSGETLPAADDNDIGSFIELGPLGTALLETQWPKALLIDEIDKSDLDLPNDLLNIFEEGEYTIPELARAKVTSSDGRVAVRTWRRQGEARILAGHVRCTHFPFVVLTSNREREFPAAFLRRCIRIAVEEPSETLLGDIVASHFGEETRAQADGLIKEFLDSRNSKDLATDQLLNAVYLVLKSGNNFGDDDRKALLKNLYKPITGPDATR